jgi:hypothetical protein
MKSKHFKYIAVFLSITCFGFSCSEEKDWREEMGIQNESLRVQLEKDQEYLRSLQKEKYSIENSSSNRDDAVRRYWESLKSSKPGESKYALDRRELQEILYPNSLGIGTSLDSTPLKEYEELVWTRRLLAEEKLIELSKNGGKITKIHWAEGTRSYGKLKGFKPDSITLEFNSETRSLNQIKQVIEHNGQFKVAILAP